MFWKKGVSVVQTLIIIAIMGMLAITVNAVLVQKINARSLEASESILESDSIDVDKLVKGN